MTDFALRWNDASAADLGLGFADLARDEGLRTSIFLSLFCDARAEPGDVLPDDSTERQGYWGDGAASVDGDRWGSKLWLLRRSKRESAVLNRAAVYARESLQWLVADAVVANDGLAVVVEWTLPELPSGFVITVTLDRPGVGLVSFRFVRTWAAEAARV